MESSLSNVVFLLHPNDVPTSSQKADTWQDAVYRTVIRILTNRDNISTNNAFEWNLKKGPGVNAKKKKLNWGYKFVKKAGVLHHAVSDFKPFTSENLDFFQQEMKYDGEEAENIDFNAHTLLDSLTAIVHDFQWEQHCIVSPVKMTKKSRRSRELERNRPKRKYNPTFDTGEMEKSKLNYVFVIGPLPKSKADIEQYFQWPLDSSIHIDDTLMPSHLKMHFRDKHEIQFFWIDTGTLFQLDPNKLDNVGTNLMEKFLHNNKGCLIPIPVLSGDFSKSFLGNFKLALKTPNGSNDCDAVFESDQQRSSKFTCDVPPSQLLPSSIVVNHYLSKPYPLPVQSSCTTKLRFVSQSNFVTEIDVILKAVGSKVNFVSVPTSQKYLLPLTYNISTNAAGFQSAMLPPCATVEEHNEDVHCLSVFGFLKNSSITLFHLHPAILMLPSEVENRGGFMKLMESCLATQKCLVVKQSCKKCCKQSCKFNDHKIGLLQPLLRTCCTLNWLRSEDLETGSMVAMETEAETLPPTQIREILQQRVNPNTTPHDKQSQCDRFRPYMLESWYNTASTSRQFLEIVNDMKSCKQSKKNSSQQKLFDDSVMSEIQAFYKFKPVLEQSAKMHNVIPEYKPKTSSQKNFDTQEEMLESIMSEYKSCVESSMDQVDQLKFTARNIVETVHRFVKKSGWEDMYEKLSDIFTEKVFMSAAKLRCRDISMEQKSAESQLQILLHMEWVSLAFSSFSPIDEDLVETESEVVISLLRLISLSTSMETMKHFLREVLLDNYAKSCGKLLFEVHNDLMLPIPDEIRHHASDKAVDDSFFDPLSNAPGSNMPSAGPFSILSSVGSQSSTDSMLMNRVTKPRRASHINPINRRQIVLPEVAKVTNNKHARSKTVDSAKSRLFSALQPNVKSEKETKIVNEKIITRSSSKKKDENQNDVTKDIGRVRRDLFASPSKSARKRSKTEGRILKVPERKLAEDRPTKANRKASVMDTPVAKQRMTALARQRIRMRRSQEDYKKGAGETIVEESPMKQEEEVVVDVPKKEPSEAKLKRSPRHSVMLTRRHSFYRDDASGRSRTIARARIVQQHKEAAPPTPHLLRTSSLTCPAPCSAPSGAGEPLISPKSLLFSHAPAPKQSGAAGPVRSRRRLQLASSDLPVKKPTSQPSETAKSDASKTTPFTATSIDSTAGSLSDNLMTSEVVTSSEAAVEEALSCVTPTKFETSLVPPSPATPLLLPFVAYKDVDTTSNTDIPKPEPSENACKPPSPPALPSKTPVKRTPRRSPRLHSNGKSVTPSPAKIGPLDSYVIRTPTSAKRPRRTTPTPTSQRKPSPNGDHIQKWPRRKRILSGRSPQERPKRLKRDSDALTPAFLQEDGVSPLPGVRDPSSVSESPDLGVYIVSSNDESQQRIRKMPLADDKLSPGVEVSQFLRHKLMAPNFPGSEVFASPAKTGMLGVPPGSARAATLFQARVGSPSSTRHVQMVLLPDDCDV